MSYEEGRGTVVFDPEATSAAKFITELERMTGFTASVITADTTNGAQAPEGT